MKKLNGIVNLFCVKYVVSGFSLSFQFDFYCNACSKMVKRVKGSKRLHFTMCYLV